MRTHAMENKGQVKRSYFILVSIVSALLAFLIIFIFVRAVPSLWPQNNEWILLTRGGKVITDREASGSCADITFGSATPSQENDISSQAKCSVTRYNPGYANEQSGAGFATIGAIQPRTTSGSATLAETYSGGIYFKDEGGNSAACNNIADDTLFFRVRLAANPLSSDGDDLKTNVWFATFDIDSDGNVDFYVRLTGGSGTDSASDKLEVIHEEGANSTIDSTDYIAFSQTNPLGISPSGDKLVRVSATPDNGTLGSSTQYFLDFQVPFTSFKNAALSQLMCEGNAVTLVNYSTSDNGNDPFKKDKMADGPTDPVVFANPNYSIEKTATDVNGGLIVPGDQVEYTITVKNLASGLNGLSITDNLPAGATFVPNAYASGRGIQVSFNTSPTSTYNLTNANDTNDAGRPSCSTAATRCEVNGKFTTGANPAGTITVTNPNIYALGSSSASLYDTITIKYRVTFASYGSYDNQAVGTTTQLPNNKLSECTIAGGANTCPGNNGNPRVTRVTLASTPNPPLASSCGLDMMLLMDTSTSIDNTELGQMKTAFKSFVNVFNGTPTQVGVISFDDDVTLQSAFTSNLSALTASGGVIDGIDGSGGTNWEAALHDGRLLFPNRAGKPDLIILASDGNPTSSTSGGPALPAAIEQADQAKLSGIRIITLGIGSDLSQANLEAISSADAYYSAANFGQLSTTLQQLASDLCGGTITVNKKVDTDGNLQTTNDQTPASGWTFNVGGNPGQVTDVNGQTTPVELNAGTYSVTETVQTGYSLLSATCNGASNNGTLAGNAINGIQLLDESIVTCTFINSPNNADLSITKTDGLTTATPGESNTYTIVVTNNGPSEVTGATVSDTLPTEYSNGTWTCIADLGSSCTLSGVGNTLSDSALNLQVGDSATYSFTADIDPGATGVAGPLSNTATVTAPGTVPDFNAANNSATDTTDLSPETDLAITKAGPNTVVAGGSMTYTLSIINNGPSNATGVTVADNLPTGVTLIGATPSQGTCSTGAGPVSCDLGNLAAGSVASVLIEVSVSASLENGANLTNTATITGNENDPNSANNSGQDATKVTVVETQADLSVTKTASPTTVAAGENITYTLTVHNDGASDAGQVTLVDSLPANTAFVSATPSGDCNEATGVVTCDLGTVDATADKVVTIVVTALGDGINPGQAVVTNTASVNSGNTLDSNPGNNTASAEVTVTPVADLSITKSATPDPVVAGETVTFNMDVTNNGPSAVSDVTASDTLPAGLTFVSASTTQGSYDNAAGPVSFDLGTLTSGQTVSLTITATVAADSPNGSNISNTATVTNNSNTFDPDTANNTASVEVDVTAEVDLSVTKTDTPDPVTAGQNLTYNITVSNAGPSTATNVILTDNLPLEVSYNSATSSQGSCDNVAGPVTCTLGTLAPGATATVQIQVTVLAATPNASTITNTATINSDETEQNVGNNVAVATTDVTTSADLQIEKTGPETVVAGNQMSYTLSVLNNGPSNAVNVVVTDDLPAEVEFVEAVPTQGACSGGVATPLECQLDNLEVGGTASILVTVLIPEGTANGTDLLNTASVSSDTSDPNMANNEGESATVTTTVSAVADLSVSKEDSPDPVVAGHELTYTLTVNNSGPSSAQDVTLVDMLPANVEFVSATPSGTCDETMGVVTCALGTLATGDDVVVTLVVKPMTDGQTLGDIAINNVATVSSETTSDPNFDNNTDEEETNVTPEADMSVVKTDVMDPVVAGNDVTYTLEVTNNGPSAVPNANVIDSLPTQLSFVSASPSQGTCFENAGTLDCNLGIMTSGGMATITVVAQVASWVTEGTVLSNTATVSADDEGTALSDPVVTNNTDSEDTTISTLADLAIEKSGSPVVVAGNSLFYTLAVVNNGPSDATNVVVTDDLPSGVNLVSATPTQGTCGTGDPLECQLGSVSAGGVASVLVEVTVPATTEEGSVLVNTASVKGDQNDPDESNNEGEAATLVTTVSTSADLSVQKQDSPDPVMAGHELTYTIRVHNDGPSDAQNVMLTDMLPPNVELVSIETDQGLCGESMNVITCDLGTVPSPGNVNITVVVIPLTDGQTLGDVQLTNNAAVSSESTADPNAENNSVEESTTVTPEADLEINKSDLQDPIKAGSNLTYMIDVKNNGPSAVPNAHVQDTLPTGVTFVSATPSAGTCLESAGQISCDLGQLNAGESASIQVVVSVPTTAANQSTLSNGAIVSCQSDLGNTESESFACPPDSNDENDSDNEITTVSNPPIIPPTRGGGGGGGGGGSLPYYNSSAAVYTSCLDWNTKRNRTFTDLNNISEEWRRSVEILKYTFQTSTGNFIIDGNGLSAKDKDVVEAKAMPLNMASRLEVLKIIMNAHCLEIKDRSGETVRDDGSRWYAFKDGNQAWFQEQFPGQNFLPNHTGNAALDNARDIMYSALYYGIIDGTNEANAEAFRAPTIAESVKIFVRTREKITARPRTQQNPGDPFWPPFYEVAAKEGISEKLLANDRARQSAIRAELMYEVAKSVLKTSDLYLSNVKTQVQNYFDTGTLPK